MASLNDLMHRFYDKFFKSGDRLPVDVGSQITIEGISIGEVKQGARGENAEPWQVALTGGNTVLDIVTVINAQTVPPGGNTGMVAVPVGDANAILFLINSSQPWRITTNSPWSDSATYSVFLYPNPTGDRPMATNTTFPHRMSLMLPNSLPTPLAEEQGALAYIFGVGVWSNLKVRIENRSNDANATVTVRAVRMRRVS